jgi:hypothetical protein
LGFATEDCNSLHHEARWTSCWVAPLGLDQRHLLIELAVQGYNQSANIDDATSGWVRLTRSFCSNKSRLVKVRQQCGFFRADNSVMVSASGHMHDLDHASRYRPHVLAKNNGMMVDSGHRMDVVDVPLFLTFFNLPCILIPDPISQTPMIVQRRKLQSHYFF